MKNTPGALPLEWKGRLVAGMDEAGRGSWAGPVVAAAVVLPSQLHLPGLNDSKLLSSQQREVLYERIVKTASYGIGFASHTEVDELGLLAATHLAFKRALQTLPTLPEHLFVDGQDAFHFDVPHTSVVRGDQRYRCIAAASVLAKVTRDRWMVEWNRKNPGYGFDAHKGYGTREHQVLLNRLGPSALHRLSYAPLQKFL